MNVGAGGAGQDLLLSRSASRGAAAQVLRRRLLIAACRSHDNRKIRLLDLSPNSLPVVPMGILITAAREYKKNRELAIDDKQGTLASERHGGAGGAKFGYKVMAVNQSCGRPLTGGAASTESLRKVTLTGVGAQFRA